MGSTLQDLNPCDHDQAQRLPSFFIVGPPRTGTSWLHEALKQSAALPSPNKETRFFDRYFYRGLEWYLRCFRYGETGKAMGEVAPTYFASSDARERIARLTPSAKIVCIFRNPVERVFSLYRLKRAYGMLPGNLEQAVLRDPELIESGRYATYLKAWKKAFGGGQVLATVFEDLRRNPQAYLDTITDFLGLPRTALRPELCHTHESEGLTHPRNYYVTRAAYEVAEWFKAERMDRFVAAAKRKILLKLLLRSGRRFESLSPDFSARLYEIFRPEVEELEFLLQRDLSAWKTTPITPAVSSAA